MFVAEPVDPTQVVPIHERLLVTVANAAHRLSVSAETVRFLTGVGTIPSVKVGTRRLIRRADLEAYAASLSPAKVLRKQRDVRTVALVPSMWTDD